MRVHTEHKHLSMHATFVEFLHCLARFPAAASRRLQWMHSDGFCPGGILCWNVYSWLFWKLSTSRTLVFTATSNHMQPQMFQIKTDAENNDIDEHSQTPQIKDNFTCTIHTAWDIIHWKTSWQHLDSEQWLVTFIWKLHYCFHLDICKFNYY